MRPAAALALCMLVTSCAAPQQPPSGARPDGKSHPETFPGALGLELRRWEVPRGADEIAALLRAQADGAAVRPETAEALRRNGLLLVRVPVGRLDALRAELAPMTLDVTAWHGQAFRWRPLWGTPTGPGPMAVAVDGHVLRLEPGQLQLLARCWVVPMEGGPELSLQVVPRQARTAPPAPGRLFPTIALDLSLPSGWACVLTGDVPDALTSGGGPHAEAPMSIGEVLFVSPAPPRSRVLLVFVPRVGPQPGEPAAGAVR